MVSNYKVKVSNVLRTRVRKGTIFSVPVPLLFRSNFKKVFPFPFCSGTIFEKVFPFPFCSVPERVPFRNAQMVPLFYFSYVFPEKCPLENVPLEINIFRSNLYQNLLRHTGRPLLNCREMHDTAHFCSNILNQTLLIHLRNCPMR